MEKVQDKTTKAAEGKVEKETATVGKGKVGKENVEMTNVSEPEITEEALREARAEAKKLCGKEIYEILNKYGCDLRAQLTLTDQGNTSQVFIIDARS